MHVISISCTVSLDLKLPARNVEFNIKVILVGSMIKMAGWKQIKFTCNVQVTGLTTTPVSILIDLTSVR